MPCSYCYVGAIDGEPVVHLAVGPEFHHKWYKIARFVVMPEWQGIGVGKRMLNWIGQYHLEGKGISHRKYPLHIVTSHTRLIKSLNKDTKWRLVR